MRASPTKIIVRECHNGTKNLHEVFAEIIDAEISQKNIWARDNENDTISAPTVKSKSVLFVSGGNNATTTI